MEQSKPLFWIIDDEWEDHEPEVSLLTKAVPSCEVRVTKDGFWADLESFGQDADLILTQISYPITETVLRKLKHCRGIAVFGSGYNNVDVGAAKSLGIPTTNVNGYCTEDLADYVLAAILHFNKHLTAFSAGIVSGEWGANAIHAPVHRLSTQTLMLLGFGRIGSVVAQKARAIGMHVMVYDPFLPAEKIREDGYEPAAMEEGLQRADFVSIHMPLTEENHGIINSDVFGKMKPSAVFINVARGGLVQEDDLVQALKAGVISGAALDVVAEEPISQNNPLLHAPNCLITPHISYASEESTQELRSRAVENALAMYRGEKPRDLVC